MTQRTRIENAFEQALDQDAAQRSLFLSALRESDPEIASEVEQLLVAHDVSDGVLDRTARPREPAVEGRRIGPYRVVRELGRGGMGVVYLAERDDGQFRRRVAVKLLRDSPDADELHHRFLAERQILASLDHPNIAQLIDGGVTDGRLPYLVMEFVEGWPITEYCDRQRLNLTDRLQLFQAVCAAVHHAHRNLVIHRDLKPANILVTQGGQVKLLDFGIAKLLNPGLSAVAAPITWTMQRVLTPEYASPEQIRGEPLSTTSDVYALGVVLYELLTGRRPHEARGGSHQELATRICEEEPERPSTVVIRGTEPASANAAAARDQTPEQLRRSLQGDLDAITLMALRKESARRHGSAELLAQDIQRHLDGLPVFAHRGTRWYYVRKFVHRHRLGVAASALVAGSLITGAGVALWQSAIAREERDRAQFALREAEAVTSFLLGMFTANDPEQLQGQETTARDLLRRGLQRAEELRDQPAVQARMLEVIGRVHHSMADYAQARALLERALSIREAHFGMQHREVAETLTHLAEVFRFQSKFTEAEAAARRALDIRRAALGPSHPDVATSLLQNGMMAVYLADIDRAITLTREAIAIREAALGADDPTVTVAITTLAATLRRRGDYEEAEQILRRAIDLNRGIGKDRGLLATTISHLAYVLDDLPARRAEAEALYREAIQIRLAAQGPDHASTAYVMGDLALYLIQVGRAREAEPLVRQQIEILTRLYGPESPRVAEVIAGEAVVLQATGKIDEAIEIMRESLERRERLLGKDNASYGHGLYLLAQMLQDKGDIAGAVTAMRQAIAIHTNAAGRETQLTALRYAQLSAIQLKGGLLKDAEESVVHSLNSFQTLRIRPVQEDHQYAIRLAVQLYTTLRRSAEAERYRQLTR